MDANFEDIVLNNITILENVTGLKEKFNSLPASLPNEIILKTVDIKYPTLILS